MNKEWTQQVDDYSSSEEACDANSSLLGKKYKNDYTPINNKVLQAEFDPRSPSNGIVRYNFKFWLRKKSLTFSKDSYLLHEWE